MLIVISWQFFLCKPRRSLTALQLWKEMWKQITERMRFCVQGSLCNPERLQWRWFFKRKQQVRGFSPVASDLRSTSPGINILGRILKINTIARFQINQKWCNCRHKGIVNLDEHSQGITLRVWPLYDVDSVTVAITVSQSLFSFMFFLPEPNLTLVCYLVLLISNDHQGGEKVQ